uniref:DNA damage-binding protein CMR1 n=1 Tax=Coccidioides posadasii RMSCC 3488 TaxID=454284 RepID=A0A0J6F6Z1_COCPO|nr:WD repeat-containing protein [Coccidioides posadasii RMSCC 3488]
MPRTKEEPELSEFEKQRAANIAERDALLKKLTLEAQSAGIFSKPPASKSSSQTKKKPAPKRVKKEDEPPVPRRMSSRLRGLAAESEIAKRKAEDEYQAMKAAAQAKRMRISGDLNVGDIVVGENKWNETGLQGLGIVNSAQRYQRTFGEEDIKKTTNKELKELREKMSGLQLWELWEPNRIKITRERIYSMLFHPTESKPLIFAGDKTGHLGILDASQQPDQNESDEEDEYPDPTITTIKPHTNTISAMHIHPSDPSKLYSGSYDSSIRALDLEKSVAIEAYAPASNSDDEPLSGIDMAPTDPHVLYFTTLDGFFGRHDMRVSSKANPGDGSAVTFYQLSEKKIGGFSLCPTQPHYMATASLDRTMKVWDLRHLSTKHPKPVGEHESSLSVSHAAFNQKGQIATTSYDNSIKIYDLASKGLKDWKPNHTLSEDEMAPDAVIRHNCQTGKWVTILRPQWQACPDSPVERFCIGNMNRFVDIYTSTGEQLAQLGADVITAVPAVAVFHRTQNWVVGGTGSAKVCLWM